MQEGDHIIIEDFFPNEDMFQHILNQCFVGCAMYYAPSVIAKDVGNDIYWVNGLYGDFAPANQLFEKFAEVVIGHQLLKCNALVDWKINWYPRTKEIEEYENYSIVTQDVHNITIFMNDNDGYLILSDGTKIPSVKNTAVVWKGNPRTSRQTTHTSGDNYLRCVMDIQAYLSEIPVGKEPIKY